VNEAASMEILKLFIEKHPAALRHADDWGSLPIHHASFAALGSPEFCQVLIEAHPGSERITNVNGLLPLHCACFVGAAAEVQYLHKLYPDGTYRPTLDGYYPIHAAIKSVSCRVNPAVVVDIVQYLLDCHPNMLIQMYQGISVLLFACRERYDDISIEAAIQVIKVIYDAHPEAIESNEIASNIHRYHQQVQRFINSELVYSRQARNHRLMTTPDDNGQLPLHTALQNNVRLGSIKLLVRGNPSALRALDNNFAQLARGMSAS